MRLIDADALTERWNTEAISRREMYKILKDAPTIDVVRCKDCKHRRTEDCPMCNECGKKAYLTADDDFCSFGERRTE